jgi:hypothetical protein
MTPARKKAGGVMMVHGEEHGRSREFTSMQMMFVSLATPFFLVPVDVEEYGACTRNLRSHESGHNQ